MTPTETTPHTFYPPFTQDRTSRKTPSGPELTIAKEVKRRADLARQGAMTESVDGLTIRPAIGKTGGVDNVGWEIEGNGHTWYVRSKEEALASIPRFKALYPG